MNEVLLEITRGEISAREMDRLRARVEVRSSGRVRDFRLVLRDSGLVLQGRAFTYYAKQLAQHAVMEASPLPIRANEIEVR